jgi:transcriptional regulator with XRE-family HTH domain
MRQLKDNILAAIRNKGLTVRSLETKAGLRQSFISNFLHDRSKNPGIDAITKIAETLGVTVDELLGKGLERKTYNVDIVRKDIFWDVVEHLLKAVKTKPNNRLTLEKFFDAVYEIYTFSLKDDKFDKEFANWFIKSRLY